MIQPGVLITGVQQVVHNVYAWQPGRAPFYHWCAKSVDMRDVGT